jgi:ferredoxin-NADP reductase
MSALRFHDLTVKRVSPEAAGAVAITLAIPDEAKDSFAFEPGQFLTLRATVAGQDVRRSYSISSPRSRLAARGELEIGIRPVENGVFSNWAAQSIKAGDTIQVMPPDGRFVVKKKRAIHRVGFAAGSGITPILSIAASTLEEQPESKFTLVYGNRRMSSVMFNEALQDLKDRYRDRLTLIHVLSRQAQEVDLLQGRIDGDKVREIIKALLPVGSMDEVFICGPDAMISATEDALVQAGVPADRIRTERFTAGLPRGQAGGCWRKRRRGGPGQGHRPHGGARRQGARARHRPRRTRARRGPQRRPRPAVLVQGRRVLHLPRQGARRHGGDGQELHPRSARGGPGLRAQLPGPRHQQAPVGELRRTLSSQAWRHKQRGRLMGRPRYWCVKNRAQ